MLVRLFNLIYDMVYDFIYISPYNNRMNNLYIDEHLPKTFGTRVHRR